LGNVKHTGERFS
jgi:hypothetical protein